MEKSLKTDYRPQSHRRKERVTRRFYDNESRAKWKMYTKVITLVYYLNKLTNMGYSVIFDVKWIWVYMANFKGAKPRCFED